MTNNTARNPWTWPLRALIVLVALVLLGTLAALFLTGCSPVSASTTDEKAPSAEPVETPTEEPPAVNEMIKPFGEVLTYEDGVSISVGEPTPFTPTENAAGADQANQVVFQITLTNGTAEPLEPLAYPTVSSGGTEATQIIDIDNPVGEVNFGPQTAILPGKTVTWLQAYSIADPADVTVDISPGFQYESAIFTNAL